MSEYRDLRGIERSEEEIGGQGKTVFYGLTIKGLKVASEMKKNDDRLDSLIKQ